MKSMVTIFFLISLVMPLSAQTVHEVFDGESIQESINAAAAGDTIRVGEGVYTGTLTLTKKLHLVGAGDRDSIRIMASGTGVYFSSGSNGSSLRGFTITSSGDQGVYIHHNGSANPYLIMNNVIKDCKEDGFLSGNYFDNVSLFPTVVLINNVFTGNRVGLDANGNPGLTSAQNVFVGNDSIGVDRFKGLSSADSILNNGNGDGFGIRILEGGTVIGAVISGNQGNGVYINDPNVATIRANQISGNSGHGIFTNGGGDYAWKISNNLITNNGGNGLFLTYDQDFNRICLTEISNNVFYGNTGAGLLFDEVYFGGGTVGHSGDILVNNNIIANNTAGGIDRVVNSDVWAVNDVNLLYNNVYNNAGGNYLNGFSAGYGSLAADPQFTNAAGGDFSLNSGSPCINAGQPSTSFLDLDLTRNDLGLYGGSWSFAQYFNNPDGARVLRLKLSNRFVRQGETITIDAEGLAR
ncbi:MAG: right-handed parallel beta-helix repeat-containing protein [Bacteroidetes bacterium]|nr:right-handed parallel beta-helix repeat-containing protein [Bacteroidota bacterium]